MAKPDNSVAHRSFDLVGRNAHDLSDALSEALAAEPHVEVQPIQRGQLLITYRYRPRWATVLAICLLPLAGLGLLFLLVRRATTCELRIMDGPRGSTVTVVGSSPDWLETRLEAMLRTDDNTVDQPVFVDGTRSSPTSESASADTDATVARPSKSTTGSLSDDIDAGTAGTDTAAATMLRVTFVGPIDDIAVRRGDRLVIGRDPSTVDGERGLAIDDPQRSLSKTHAVIGVDADGPYACDLHSTNGSLIQLAGRAPMPLTSGDKTRIGPPSARLQFGGIECIAVVETGVTQTSAPDAERTVIRPAGGEPANGISEE
ncbi:MAG: FHA domain-containing protein [Actinomycetota bacterium]